MAIDVIAQLNAIGTYPLYDSRQGLGGLMQVADAAARAAITTARRRHGMEVFQQDTQVTYRLGADLTTWTTVTGEMTADNTINVTTDAIQAAIDSVPTAMRRYHQTINVAAGTFTGFRLDGFSGGAIDIVGTYVTPTVTTGVTTGTAGAGSGATIVNKPTGAPDWTPNELVGVLFKPTSGGAYFGEEFESVGRIISNTGSQLVLESSMYGLDATTPFVLVQPGTVISLNNPINVLPAQINPPTYLVGIFNSTAEIKLRRVKILGGAADYGLVTAQAQFVSLINNTYENAFILPSYSSSLQCSTSWFKSSYYYAFGQNVSTFLGNFMDDSSAAFEVAQYVNASVTVSGDVGYASAITITDVITAILSGAIASCTSGTPVVLHNIHNFRISGSVTGANPGTAYGAQVDGGGQFRWAGLAITGSDSNPVLFENHELSYAQLSGNGTFESNGSYGKWGSGSTVRLDLLTVFEGQQINYAFVRMQDPAYKEITANAAGTQGAATVIGYVITMVKTAGANHSIRFFGAAEALITGGLHGEIRNLSGNNVRLYPPSGFKIFYQNGDTGLNNYLNMPADVTFFWATDNDGNYHVS